MPKSEERVVVVDPKLLMQRMLHYRERHHAWHIFRTVYWSIYLLIMGVLLIYYTSLSISVNTLLGIAAILGAVMLIIFGLVESLHHKLMKKYG